MTTREITEGQWTYRFDFGGPVAATSIDGTVINAVDIVEARRRVFEVGRNVPSAVTYTISGGPGRALSARRFTQSYIERP